MRTTIVAGQVVFEGGAITTVDEAALRAEMRTLMAGFQLQRAEALRQAARLEPCYRQMLQRAAAHEVGMKRALH